MLSDKGTDNRFGFCGDYLCHNLLSIQMLQSWYGVGHDRMKCRYSGNFPHRLVGMIGRGAGPGSVLLGVTLLLAGCQPGVLSEGLAPAKPGTLVVTIAGLPAGALPGVQVTGPGGYSTTLDASQTLAGLTPGTYTLSAPAVTHQGNQWAATTSTLFSVVGSGTSAAATITYAATTGSLQVAIGGLVPGHPAAVVVNGPAGFSTLLVGTTTLSGLQPGSYDVVASPIEIQGEVYQPGIAVHPVVVEAGTALPTVTVSYALATGRLAISFGGVPVGGTPSVQVTGPGGFAQAVTSATTLVGLTPGSYTVAAAGFAVGSVSWGAVPPTQVVSVAASMVPASASIMWAPVTANLSITTAGLPDGLAPSIQVSGPNGYTHPVTGSEVLTGLAPGSYAITAGPVSSGGLQWNPVPASQSVTLAAGATASAGVAWALQPGSLQVTVAGVPGGASAAVTVTGPQGFSAGLTGSQPLGNLTPGSYTIAAQPVVSGSDTWNPAPPSQVVQVVSGSAAATITYSQGTGALALTVTGVPAGSASIAITGPGGFSASATGSQSWPGLLPGTYQVSAAAVALSGTTYQPSPATASVTVTAGASAPVAVSYAPTTGSLAVTISGLPGGTLAAVTVSGPGGASHNLTASQTLSGLAPGSWTITGAVVTSGPNSWAASPPSQVVSITAGGNVNAAVAYALVPATTFNLRIDGAYLTQAVQRLDHGVELVAGRDAYLRVFVVANEANTVTPQVRARLYHGATEVQSWLINAGSGAVTQSVNEGTLTSSWNVLVPGALIVPGARILTEVDPGGAIPEQDEGDNFYPATAVPQPVAVRTLLPFEIRLVPVLQSVNGLQGNVTTGNMNDFLTSILKTMPISAHDVDVRAAYTTNAPALQSNNGNGAWGTILSEILALRNATDGSSRYYYGVVKTSYSSGIAGMGYVPSQPTSTAKAAIGWDFSGSRARILAHELGHNFGRSHAPCGGAGGPDPSYPHAGGQIGAWGLDVGTLAVKPPTTFFDLMGYCPPNEWVSDYTWNAVLNYRSGSPTGAPQAAGGGAGPDDGLLVWGRVTPGGVVLEPAFRVAPTAAAPPTRGAWRVEGRDATGSLVFSQSFAPQEVADLPGGVEEHFAIVLPLGAATLDRVATLVVSGPGGATSRATLPGAPVAADPVAQMPIPGRRQVTWDASRHPMALVRDAATGEILSFARGGAVTLFSNASQLDIQLSDGVRVVRKQVGVR